MIKLNEIEKLICELYGLEGLGTKEQALFLLGLYIGSQGTEYMIKNNMKFAGAVTSFNHCQQVADLTKTGAINQKAWNKLQEIARGQLPLARASSHLTALSSLMTRSTFFLIPFSSLPPSTSFHGPRAGTRDRFTGRPHSVKFLE